MQGLATQFEQLLQQKESICHDLEAIADGLPDLIDTHSSLAVAQRLLPLIRRTHAFEEETLFPKLAHSGNCPADFEATIDRLKFEHWADEDFAEQIYHQLRDFVASRQPGSAELLAWMLRGLFQSMRRHMVFERQFLLPLTRGQATAGKQ